MSRTPLFRLLRRAAAVAVEAQRSAQPLDEVIARSAEARLLAWNRRQFLRNAGLGAIAVGTAACAPRVSRPPSSSGGDVVIVGAGIAGLSAATRLRQSGVPTRVFEAQDRVGGRMLSLRDHFPDGQVCELGGELIDSGHTRMRELVPQLGLALDDLLDEPPGIIAESWFFDGRLRSEREVIEAFAPLAQRIAAAYASLPDDGVSHGTQGPAAALDTMSISAWLDAQQSSGWLRALIEVAYTTEMGLDCDEQSALNLIDFISTELDHFRIFGDSDERFHVRGGNDQVTSALATRLGSAVETGHVLEAIGRRANGRYRLGFRKGGASIDIEADQVVLAIPLTTLRRVRIDVPLPAATRSTIDTLGYGNNTKLMIGFNERVWRSNHQRNGSLFTDAAPQSTWETSRAQAGAHGILTNFTGGRHAVAISTGNAKAHADAAVAALEPAFPGLAAARVGAREVRMPWPTNPWVMGSYACLRPGQWTTLAGILNAPVDRLHFAGEHCAVDNQGFMEGGVESGYAVADAILKQRSAMPLTAR